MMDIIFLDIDGVLTDENCFVEGELWQEFEANKRLKKLHRYPLQPACVERFNRLVEESGASIVISSTWRIIYEFDELVSILENFGVKGNFLGRTGRDNDRQRGNEIQHWLDVYWDKLGIKNFVILDDDSDMVHLMPFLVQTDFYKGLQDEHVDKALEILGEKELA